MEVQKEKTRLIEIKHHVEVYQERRGEGKLETFNQVKESA
jgi:hypothetical protein